MRASREISEEILFHFSLSDQFLTPLNAIQRGTSYPAIRDSDALSQPFPLAPQAEQNIILSALSKNFSYSNKLKDVLDINIPNIKRLNQSILQKAFAGKLVEQDPTDEPASALLARIHAEREAAKPKKKGKK